jgi:hypothetical protein
MTSTHFLDPKVDLFACEWRCLTDVANIFSVSKIGRIVRWQT